MKQIIDTVQNVWNVFLKTVLYSIVMVQTILPWREPVTTGASSVPHHYHEVAIEAEIRAHSSFEPLLAGPLAFCLWGAAFSPQETSYALCFSSV